jgi:membrane protease YdiL (CAAX protease family)
VRLTDIVHWPGAGADRAGWQRFAAPGRAGLAAALLLGAALGGVLGLGGQAYLAALHLIPQAAHLIDTTRAHLDSVPHARLGLFIMAVVVAPFAEEFLFRGLLFRALDREWGGWRAVLGSAAFFAIYHPPLAWPAVGTLGAINCIVFKRTGRLAPAIALHMAYNAVVLG